MPIVHSKNIINQNHCQVKKSKAGNNRVQSSKIRKPCRNTKCPYHFFYTPIFQENNTHLKPTENDLSREYFNCCLELDRALTPAEIASLYGVSRQTVDRILDKAIYKLQKNCGIEKRNYHQAYGGKCA